MDESAALDVTAARAVETGDRDRLLWTDTDREWASRAAATIVGERASADEFLARRAQLVLERIGTRQPSVTRTVRAIRWRPWVGVVVVLAAFVLGVLVDRIGGGSSINLLAPPVFALVAWTFLGFGILPPNPSWGNMLSGVQAYMWRNPWLAFYPGFTILIVVLCINFIGDALRDALDPRLKT